MRTIVFRLGHEYTHTLKARLDSEWQKDNIHTREQLVAILSEYSRDAFTVDSFSDREILMYIYVRVFRVQSCA